MRVVRRRFNINVSGLVGLRARGPRHRALRLEPTLIITRSSIAYTELHEVHRTSDAGATLCNTPRHCRRRFQHPSRTK